MNFEHTTAVVPIDTWGFQSPHLAHNRSSITTPEPAENPIAENDEATPSTYASRIVGAPWYVRCKVMISFVSELCQMPPETPVEYRQLREHGDEY